MGIDYFAIAIEVEERTGLVRSAFPHKIPRTVGDLCNTIANALHAPSNRALGAPLRDDEEISRIVMEVVSEVCHCNVNVDTELRRILE